MSLCYVPQNQFIYQALIDKAASYPPDKFYQANAYKNAAESILTYDKNIYDEVANNFGFPVRPPNIGIKIEDFIYNFIRTNPAPPQPTISFPTVTSDINALLLLRFKLSL